MVIDMALKPWPIVMDELYGDVPDGLFPAKDANYELVLAPFPGLKSLCSFPNCSEIREGWSWGDYMYWLARRGSDSVLFRVDSNGAFAEIGSFSSSYTGPAWMKNNETQLCIVDGITGYVFTPSLNQMVQITDLDFPGASSMDYQDGYGLFSKPNTNIWFHSSIGDFLSFDALDFYSKEAKTDAIRSIRSFQREPYIFGEEKGIELWYNAGGDNSSAQNPTFARNSGGLIELGSAAPKGDSDMAGTAVTWLTNQGQLAQAAGTNVKIVSNQMFDREVGGDGTLRNPGYATLSDAIAFSYRDQGHIFHQVTFPTEDVTWVFDGTTGLLLKRSSYRTTGDYGRHRANCYVLHKGKHYVGDFENGTIYEMDANYYDDDGHTIRRQLYSKEIVGGKSRISFPNIQIMVESGMGLPSGDTPQIGLEFSADGGNTWSNMVNRSVGLVGEYTRQANFNQMGSGYRRMYRLTMTAAILWRVIGIDLGF